MSKLALLGGDAVRARPWPSWPEAGEAEELALVATVRSGDWGGIAGGDQQTASTKCSADPCFELVLSEGVSDGRWSQETATTYKFAPPVGSATTYTYDTATGTLQ